jgi:hypothetical protein
MCERTNANSGKNSSGKIRWRNLREPPFYGDNLDILRRKIAADTVDLCDIDPPFDSKRNYNQIYNNVGGEDRAQARAIARGPGMRWQLPSTPTRTGVCRQSWWI